MRSVVLLIVAAIVGACSGGPGPASSPTTPAASPSPTTSLAPSPTASRSPTALIEIGEVRSTAPRQPIGSATDEQLAQLVAQDADFAIRLYRQIASAEQGNVFISPYSISTALSMAYAGARGNTAAEMAAVMGIWDSAADWHGARNRLELELAKIEALPWPDRQGTRVPLTLEPVNTMFGQDGFPFEPDFLNILAASYGAGMRTVDFVTETEQARRAINAWVADKTHDRIPQLLAEDDLSALTRFVLVNAIYFKANWMHQFDPEQTRTEPFSLLDGSTRDVEMMHGTFDLQFLRRDGWQAVSLPYWGAEMLVVVPDAGRFAEVEAGVTAELLANMRSTMSEYEVTLGLPRWESESRANLVEALQAMGIVDLFEPFGADLTGIANAELYVTKVIHQANVTVDEEGTEAAAATAVIGELVCACGPDGRATLTIDRPFLYFIRDATAGEVLFMGRLLEP